jgi:hypothetical protein
MFRLACKPEKLEDRLNLKKHYLFLGRFGVKQYHIAHRHLNHQPKHHLADIQQYFLI